MQCLAIVGPEETPARGVGDLHQHLQVDLGIAAGRRIANAYGVHPDPPVASQLGGVGRGDGAAGVIAVRQQDKHLLSLPGLLQQLDGQANGVPERRIGARHADADLIEQQLQAGVIQGQRRLGVGAGAKDDETEAILLAAQDEVLHRRLHRAQAIALAAIRSGVIPGLHGLGDVDGQHDVAGGAVMANRGLDQHGAGAGRHQQRPDQQVEAQLPAPPVQGAGRLAQGLVHGGEEGHAQGAAGGAIGGQIAVGQPGQWQQEQCPGGVKLPHDALLSSVG
ncbi:hypothetical protein D3C86_795190 [compost metagenome]